MPPTPIPIRWQHRAIFVTLAAVLIFTFRSVWGPLAGTEARVFAGEDLNLAQADLSLIGFVTAAATAARELLLIPLLSINLLAFIVPIGLDDRLLLHIAPFAAVLVGLAVGTLAATLSERRPSWLRVLRSDAA